MQNFWRRIYFNLSYLGHPRWDTRISPPELLEFIQDHPAGRALDLGCGTGTNLVTLSESGWQVTGVDYAPLATQIARHRLTALSRKHLVITGDVTSLPPFPALFDLILDIGCYHNLNLVDRVAYCHNVERLLSPAGTWLLYAHFSTEKQLGLNESDILGLSERFRLLNRKEGRDGTRISNWLWFQLPIHEE